MATRVNTKVVWGIVIGVVLALVAVGALWFLQSRKDPTRYAQAGEKLFEEGKFENSWNQYRVAVNLDPANLAYIERAEEALTRFIPETATDAQEYYEQYIQLMNWKSRQYSNDLDALRRVLDELMLRAKVVGNASAWELAEQAAVEMVNRMSQDNPVRDYAMLYRDHFRLRNSQRLTIDEMIKLYDDPETDQDLTGLAARLPESDLAQYTQVWAGLLLAEQYERTNRPGVAEQQFERSRGDLARANAAVGDGPEVARINLVLLAHDRQANAEASGEDLITDDVILAAIQRTLDLAEEANDRRLLLDAVDVVVNVGGEQGARFAAGSMERYLDDHPDDLVVKFSVARLLLRLHEFDAAEEYATQLVDAPDRGVGLDSWLHNDIRRSSLTILASTTFDRWETAAPDDTATKDAAIARLGALHEQLSGLVKSSATDSNVLQVRAMESFAKQNYVEAAAKAEEAIRQSEVPSDELLVLAGTSLDRVGQVGLAIERYQTVVDRQPQNVGLLVRLAQLQLKARQPAAAESTLVRIEAIDPDYVDLEPLSQAAKNQKAASTGAIDPVAQAVMTALQTFNDGNADEARNLIESALAQWPNDARLYESLVRIEVSGGTPDSIQAAMERALTALPTNTRLRQMQALVETDDPIERVESMVAAATESQIDRMVGSARGLSTLVNQYEAQIETAERRGDAAKVSELLALSDRATGRMSELMTEAEALDDSAPELVRLKLDRAIAAEDWSQADQLLDQAAELDLDQVGGRLLRGQYLLTRGMENRDFNEDAVRTLREATELYDFSAATWRLLGQAYESVGNNREAEAAYENAFSRNPTDLLTLRRLGTLLLRTGNTSRARPILEQARRVAPTDVAIREAWLTLEKQAGNLDRVLATRLKTYAANPYDRTNAMQLAMFLGENTPDRRTIFNENLEDAAYSDQAWRRMGASGQNRVIDDVKSDWNDFAERILTHVASLSGDAFEPLIVRAEMMRRNGQYDVAAKQLRDHIDAQENDVDRLDLLLRLGRYQISIARFNHAAETLRTAQGLQSESVREADRALADLYLARNAPAGAKALLRPLWESGQDPQVGTRLVNALIAGGDLDDAETVIGELDNNEAVSSVQILDMTSRVQGQRVTNAFSSGAPQRSQLLTQYRATLNEFMRAAPNDVRPYIMLAQSQFVEYRESETKNTGLLQDALLTLQRADTIQANLKETRGLRAAILLERGDSSGAVAEVRRALDAAPEDEALRGQYIELLAGINRDLAIAAAQEGVQLDPTLVRWHEMLGDLIVSGDPAKAATHYLDAYALQPTPVMLAKWAQAQFNLTPPGNQAVLDRIDEAPFSLDENPGTRCLRAVALKGLGRHDDALEALRLAFASFEELRAAGGSATRSQAWFAAAREVFPVGQSPELESFARETIGRNLTAQENRMLAQVWFAEGATGHSRAIELQQDAVAALGSAEDQSRIAMLGELGTYHVLAGQNSEALSAFEQIIAIDRNNAQALNNAAFLLAEYLNGPAEAITYADRASRLAPSDPNILDTLGWAYYKAGRLQDAENALQRSLDRQRAPGTYYHMARVQFAAGNRDSARLSLNQAADLGPDRETEAKILALTVEINSG